MTKTDLPGLFSFVGGFLIFPKIPISYEVEKWGIGISFFKPKLLENGWWQYADNAKI